MLVHLILFHRSLRLCLFFFILFSLFRLDNFCYSFFRFIFYSASVFNSGVLFGLFYNYFQLLRFSIYDIVLIIFLSLLKTLKSVFAKAGIGPTQRYFQSHRVFFSLLSLGHTFLHFYILQIFVETVDILHNILQQFWILIFLPFEGCCCFVIIVVFKVTCLS